MAEALARDEADPDSDSDSEDEDEDEADTEDETDSDGPVRTCTDWVLGCDTCQAQTSTVRREPERRPFSARKA